MLIKAKTAARETADQCGFCTLFTKSVPHILENIFFALDYESFKKCLEVNGTWKELLTSESFVIKGKSAFRDEILKDEKTLHSASGRGESDQVRRLLSSGMVDVNCVDHSWPHPTALYKTAYCGHRGVVNALLEGGAEIDKTDHCGRTPLHAAALKGHKDAVKLLLDGGADCDKADEWGQTPLHSAAWNGHRFVIQVLLEGGAEPDARNNRGETPLYLATWVRRQDVADLLIEWQKEDR